MTYEFPDCLKLIPNTSNPEAAFEDLMPHFLKLLQSGDRKELKRTYTTLVALADEVDPGPARGLTVERASAISWSPRTTNRKDGVIYYRCLTLMSLIRAAQHEARVAEWGDIPVSGDFWLGGGISRLDNGPATGYITYKENEE